MAAPQFRLYSERAAKFEPKFETSLGTTTMAPPPPPKVKATGGHGVENIFEDYCANSSIHGFKYFVGAHRTLAEKAWWVIVCILSVYFCGQLIETVYEKWRRSPVVVTFAEKLTPVYDVPFPAVTVCPVTKVKMATLNFTAAYQALTYGDNDSMLTDEVIDQVLAMVQVCDFSFSNLPFNHTYDDNLVSIIQRMAIPFGEMFLMCVWKNRQVNCSELFKPTLTESGICYTFNGMSAEELLRTDQFHQEFEHLGETRSAANWTMEDGYHPRVGVSTYPRRVLSAGAQSGMLIFLKTDKADMDFLCGNSFQGYQVQLHSPNTCPQISTQNIRVPLNHAFQVRVEPFMITTTAAVRSYSVDNRLCYYSHERYLRFFAIYTKRSCEVECLANFTLYLCGCVHFSMPRPAGVRICGLGKKKCVEEAEIYLQEQAMGGAVESGGSIPRVLSSCRCLPSCTFLQYNAEISQSPFEWRRLTDAMGLFPNELKNAGLSTMNIYFKESQFITIKRNQLFELNDFIANCGGLLGLFMGVSLLSIVEVLYFFTLKPLVNYFWRREKRPTVSTVAPSDPHTPSYALRTFLRDAA
ncbi:pickpocket protein 28-like [Anopheles cruzii]|uniref:pickpocket protein 28-like n=1 Tax=Anopheles cruzii TaxID=68878 RepID=UPI0022EC43FE|nr:pickpocket protein 28-like [Anopheles cruzii]